MPEKRSPHKDGAMPIVKTMFQISKEGEEWFLENFNYFSFLIYQMDFSAVYITIDTFFSLLWWTSSGVSFEVDFGASCKMRFFKDYNTPISPKSY